LLRGSFGGTRSLLDRWTLLLRLPGVILPQKRGCRLRTNVRPATQASQSDGQVLGFQRSASRLKAFLLGPLLLPIQTQERRDDRFVDMGEAGYCAG